MITVAALSDVHGNTPALRAVLAAVEREVPDVVVNLGDVASGGVDPRGTLDLLRAHPEIVTVRGNHERQLLTVPPERMSRSDRYAHEQLDDDDRAWLRALPVRRELGAGVLAIHGTPADDLRYLLQTVDRGLREATDAEVLERLGDEAGRWSLYLCGHTHLQRTRVLPDGSVVVNPGSVGWPAYDDDLPEPHVVEAGTPHARFSVVRGGPGDWRVVEHAVEYDVEEAAALAERNDRPDVVHALRTGRVPVAADGTAVSRSSSRSPRGSSRP